MRGRRSVESRRGKQIIAVVRPHLAEKMLDALNDAPLEAVSISPVKGYGRQEELSRPVHRRVEYSLALSPQGRDHPLGRRAPRREDLSASSSKTARTGRMGDGKIFVLPGVAVSL